MATKGAGVLKKHHKIKNIIKTGASYTLQGRSFCFMGGNPLPDKTSGDGLLAWIQDCIKKNGRLYYFLLNLFSPFRSSGAYRNRLSRLLNAYNEDAVILNIGSGPYSITNREDIINVDLYPFKEVDIVADAADLPINENSIDLIINTAMIEHVANPARVISEMHQKLKKNGEIICFLPFIAPFHAAPHDYSRWTLHGVKQLFHQFSALEVGIGVGPTSALLWTFQEWMALLLSCGSKTLHDLFFLILMILTSPLKNFDFLLERFPGAEKIAGGFYVAAKK